MATLEKIRSKGKFVMVVVFVALLCFIIGDFLSNSSAIVNQDREQIGEVCGKKMNYNEFQQMVDANTTFAKMQGTFSNDANARNEAWQSFILSSVMEDQTEKIGMYVTPEEMEYATKVNPHSVIRNVKFLQDENGNFSRAKLDNLLKSFKNFEDMSEEERMNIPNYETLKEIYPSWLCIENNLSSMLLYDKYFIMLSSATKAPKAEKEFIKQYNGETYDYAYAYKSYMMVPDSAYTVSDAEAKAKYQEMEKRFKTKAYRTIKAITFNVRPLAEDSIDAKERILDIEKDLAATATAEEALALATQECDPSFVNKDVYVNEKSVDISIKDFAFNAKKNSVLPTFQDGLFYKTAKLLSEPAVRPDSVKVSCIYLVAQKNENEIKKTVDSLQNELKNGAIFSDLAGKHSMIPTAKDDKGVLGWFQEGFFSRLKDFDEKIFTSRVGDVIAIDNKGEHFLFKVDSISSTSSKKVKLAEIAVKIEAGSNTYRKYYEQASKFINDNPTIEEFLANGEKEGLFVQEFAMQENDATVSNIENSRKIVKWAFENEVGSITSQPFEFTDQCVVAALVNAVEEGYAPYSVNEVKRIVDNEVMNDKKSETIIEEWSKCKDLSEMGTVDTMKSVSFDSDGVDSYVLAKLNSLNVNEQSEPFKGRSGVYAVKVLNKEQNSNAEPKDNSGRKMQYMYNQMYNVLINNAEIVDNRSNFY